MVEKLLTPGVKYANLLKPGKINTMTVKNRMKYAATVDNFCNPDGSLNDREIAFLEERAKGGFGMVTSQGGFTDPLGKGYMGQMGLHRDEFIPGLKRLSDAIKKHKARSVCQIMHTGRYAHPHEYGVGDAPVGPTAMPAKIPRYHPCKELSLAEIKQIIEDHGQAARRIKAAGFDAIEICGIVGYLIADFLCKWSNHRNDEYGGTVEKRAKFMIDIVKRVRKEVGPDYPILARLNATDHMEGGNTEEEYVQIAKWLVQSGVDALSLTIGWHESSEPAITMEIEPGHWLYLAKHIKEELRKDKLEVPTFMAYRLNRPDVPDKAIADGIIDYWEMCRPGIADPELPKKVTEGRPEDICTCPACNLGCFERIFFDSTMSCMVNPRVGREYEDAAKIKPAKKKKNILVVGGGPGGLEAARVAALRGHKVSLYERSDSLGGLLKLAGATPFCHDWNYMIAYYANQMKKLGVDVHLNTNVNAELINKIKPDSVILATGSKPARPNLPGVDRKNVVQALDVIAGKAQTGNEVVVLGGRAAGIQTAELLATKGKKVTVVEESKRVGRDVNAFNIWGFRHRLGKAGVKVLVNSKIESIGDAGVVVSTDGNKQTLKADTVVLAAGQEADKSLLEELGTMAEVEEIQSVGDCVAPRKAYNAVHDGFRIGVAI